MWALAAVSAVFWGLRLFVAAPQVPPHARTAELTPAARGDLTRLFGVDAPPPAAEAAPEVTADARFQLIGVLSPRSTQAAREGVALIVVDGKPAKAFRVGAVVDGMQVLKSVHARGAMLGTRDGPAVVALNLAPPAPASTGTLPPAGGAAPILPPPPLPTPMPTPFPNRPGAYQPPQTGVPTGPSSLRRQMPASNQGQATEPYQPPTPEATQTR